ncbi:MAG: heme ABC transporter permease [Bacteroidetes bacterium]|nr:MAG: heme ABC transporter permease [Bacteroidota bacterium]
MSASWKASTQPGSQSGKLSDALSNLTSASAPLADPGDRTPHPAVKASNRTAILSILGVLLLFVTLLSAAIGAVSIPFSQLSAILLSKIGIHLPVEIDPRADLVLTGIRLPRVLLGVLAGMALAVSGALMQGLFRNPLADPALIGISSGSSFGASLMIVFGSTLPGFVASSLGLFTIALAAFAGGLMVTFIVYTISTRDSQTSVATMLLAGIAMNALCGAGTGGLILFSTDTQLRDLTFWSLGSLGAATWQTLAVVAPFVIIVLIISPWLARALNALLLGESAAHHLGIETQLVKRLVILLSALAVGAVTAVTGLIGFVGLVVPHLIRLTFGPDHRLLLPASALLGGILLVFSDLLARILLQPAEIPIGIITAIFGAPFFLWLLMYGFSRNLRV